MILCRQHLRLGLLSLTLGLLVATGCSQRAAGPSAPPQSPIAQYEVRADTPAVQTALEKALGEQGFGILFRANMGATFAKFADAWGDDYNRSGLAEIRAVLFCNPKYANEAANADPTVLALCPLSITLLQKSGTTTLLFERPSQVLSSSAAQSTIRTVESKVIVAIETAVAQSQP